MTTEIVIFSHIKKSSETIINTQHGLYTGMPLFFSCLLCFVLSPQNYINFLKYNMLIFKKFSNKSLLKFFKICFTILTPYVKKC